MIKEVQTQAEQEGRYEFKNIGGGYSQGSDVLYDQTVKKMTVELNLYGGSKKQAGKYKFAVPSKVEQLLTSFFKQRQDADQEVVNTQNNIKAYKNELKQEIDKAVAEACLEFDGKLKQAVFSAIRRINEKYK